MPLPLSAALALLVVAVPAARAQTSADIESVKKAWKERPAAQAMAPGEGALDYLSLLTPEGVGALADRVEFPRNWRGAPDLFKPFNRFRDELLALIGQKAGPAAARRPAALPEPIRNRVALTVLDKKLGLFGGAPGTRIPFIAKYLLDSGLVVWSKGQTADDSEIGKALASTRFGAEGRKYRMNCFEFIRFAAYLAGVPPSPTWKSDQVNLPSSLRKELPGLEPVDYLVLLNGGSYLDLGEWFGYWRPVADAKGPKSVDGARLLRDGDLAAVYYGDGRVMPDGTHGWDFHHVELLYDIVNAPDPGDGSNPSVTLGNIGSGPRLGKRLEPAWIERDRKEAPGGKVRYVVYRFHEHLPTPTTLDLSGR